MVGGGSDLGEASKRLGLPVELVGEAEDFKGADEGIYPDNWPIATVFSDMMTQWRVGVAGATGLDYSALPIVLSIRRIKAADREEVFSGLQVMEQAALEFIRKKAEN